MEGLTNRRTLLGQVFSGALRIVDIDKCGWPSHLDAGDASRSTRIIAVVLTAEKRYAIADSKIDIIF